MRNYCNKKNIRIFAPQNWKERCRSGRSGRTRNAVYGQLYRGFESLSFRKIRNEARRCRLSTSFCFVTLRHTNLFVGRSGMKTKVVDLSTPCGVRILQGAPRRAKGKTSRHEVATKSIPLFIASFFRFKRGACQSVAVWSRRNNLRASNGY